MKKKMRMFVCLCLAAVLMSLTACSVSETGVVKYTEKEAGRTKENAVSELQEDTQKVGQETVLAQLAAAQEERYAYRFLSEKEKKLYVQILKILREFGTSGKVAAKGEKELSHVFQCVMNDHPELFYVSGYAYTKYTMGDEVTGMTLSGTYTMTRAEAEEKQAGIDAYVCACLAGVDQGSDEYEKVKYVYEYLILNTDYNLQAAENQNICSVFLNGESVCQGYAKAMQYLLDELGISNTLVSGFVENGEGHAWNLVLADGAYYYVDPTWGDAFYELDSAYEEPAERLPSINYDYLCVTTDQLTVTHTIDNVVPVPRCVEMRDNYYVREGAYFTSCDKTQMQTLFERAYEEQRESVTVKCSDPTVYGQMKQVLLEKQEVFHYLQNTDGNVAYTDNDAQMTISFWL